MNSCTHEEGQRGVGREKEGGYKKEQRGEGERRDERRREEREKGEMLTGMDKLRYVQMIACNIAVQSSYAHHSGKNVTGVTV